MQPPDDRPQTAFQHPMKLEGLARRDTQGVAAMCASKFVELQPLCRAAHSTRQTHPDHELISGFQLLAAAFVAQIAVILLIYPVELHQLDIVAGDRKSVVKGKRVSVRVDLGVRGILKKKKRKT